MVNHIEVQFLGTSSAPSATRNYSSLLVKHNSDLVMVDCGESTQNQFRRSRNRLSNLHTILVTHLHQDHTLGIVPFLTDIMNGAKAAPGESETEKPRIEIFGPSGLRALLRTTLSLTYCQLAGKYTVHELLFSTDAPYPSPSSPDEAPESVRVPTPDGRNRVLPVLPLHENELPGRDIYASPDHPRWTDFVTLPNGVSISAAPIIHRVPCLGYVFTEPWRASPLDTRSLLPLLDANADRLLSERGIRNPRMLLSNVTRKRETVELPDGTKIEPPPLDIPGRKVVVLGDCSDATGPIEELAMGADVLVHECTNAAIPPEIERPVPNPPSGGRGRGKHPHPSRPAPPHVSGPISEEAVRQKAASRGHSTPAVAGEFARRVGARMLLLNHFSVRYLAPPGWLVERERREMELERERREIEREMEREMEREKAREVVMDERGEGGNGSHLRWTEEEGMMEDGGVGEEGEEEGRAAGDKPSSNPPHRGKAPLGTVGRSRPRLAAPEDERRLAIMRCIEDQATKAWGGDEEDRRAWAAYDMMSYVVPARDKVDVEAKEDGA